MTAETDHTPGTAPADRARAAALAGSAAASAAVSAADAGPLADEATAEAALAWRWVVGTDSLDLYAVQAESPLWRATCVGAGGALHRARVALAAEGLAAAVTLLPEAPDRGPERGTAPGRGRGGDLGRRSGAERVRRTGAETPYLARLVVTETIDVTPEAVALYAATDPRASASEPGAVAHAALADGPGRPPARPGGVLRGVRNRRLGGPRPGIRRGPAPSRSVIRDLMSAARAEGVRLRLIRDGAGLVGLLHGPDTREAWLRAGMAASAVRLHARRHGLSTVAALATDHPRPPAPTADADSPDAAPDASPARAAWRRIGDREGWLSVGIATPYLRLRLTPS